MAKAERAALYEKYKKDSQSVNTIQSLEKDIIEVDKLIDLKLQGITKRTKTSKGGALTRKATVTKAKNQLTQDELDMIELRALHRHLTRCILMERLKEPLPKVEKEVLFAKYSSYDTSNPLGGIPTNSYDVIDVPAAKNAFKTTMQAEMDSVAKIAEPMLAKLDEKVRDLVKRFPAESGHSVPNMTMANILQKVHAEIEAAYTSYKDGKTMLADVGESCKKAMDKITPEIQATMNTHRGDDSLGNFKKIVEQFLNWIDKTCGEGKRMENPNRWFKPATADTFEETKKAIDTLKPPTP